jgi:hypothetical protein
MFDDVHLNIVNVNALRSSHEFVDHIHINTALVQLLRCLCCYDGSN